MPESDAESERKRELEYLRLASDLIQRGDGYGTESETFISRTSAVMLKKRNLAVTGWNREMYPTKSGHAFAAVKPGPASG